MTDAARDPGLQPERTRLAWTRTALAVSVNAVLLVRSGIVESAPGFIVMGLILTVGAVAAIAFGIARGRELARTAPVAPLHPLVVATTAVVTIATCLAGIASVVIAG